MERNENYKVNLAQCPNCDLTCVEGHDDDGLYYCPRCGHTFSPKKPDEVTLEEFEEIRKNAKERITRSGWYGFVKS